MEPDTKPSTKGMIVQVLCSLTACAAILSPGMNMGYSAFALKSMKSQLNLTTDQETWIASLSNLVTPIGCLLSGPILNRWGRKFTLLLVTVPCTIGWFLMAFEPNLTRIYIGRILTGLATGLASTPGSVYAAECTLSTLRGYLMSGSTVFISIGIFVVNVLGLVYKDNWQIVAGIGGAVSIAVALITLVFLPESPVWLVTNGYEARATKSLKFLRGTTRTEVIQKELEIMLMSKRKANAINTESSMWANLCRPEAYKPLIILNTFFAFQQLTGIYVAVSYTLDFVKDSGVTKDIGIIAVMLGALRLVVIFLGTCSSKLMGRRFTALVSGIGMTPCLLVLAYLQYSKNKDVHSFNNQPLFSAATNLTGSSLINSSIAINTSTALSFSDNASDGLLSNISSTLAPLVNSVQSDTMSYAPLIAIVLYMVFSTFGFLIIPWSLLGEIYPAKSRDAACGITAFLAYLFSFVMVKSYPYIVRTLGTYGVFSLFGVMALVGTVFVALYLPETQGKTLAEIEQYFIGSRTPTNIEEASLSANGRKKSPTIVRQSIGAATPS